MFKKHITLTSFEVRFNLVVNTASNVISKEPLYTMNLVFKVFTFILLQRKQSLIMCSSGRYV
jgi:hypothetical protein